MPLHKLVRELIERAYRPATSTFARDWPMVWEADADLPPDSPALVVQNHECPVDGTSRVSFQGCNFAFSPRPMAAQAILLYACGACRSHRLRAVFQFDEWEEFCRAVRRSNGSQ